ncbi:MAG TPA: amidase [Thermoleophilia bacterium]|nr:amidase [Thermoleophilia bacterium]
MDPLCARTATELAALIAAGEASSREVVEAHLARIDEVNPDVNAVTVVLRESALAAADTADAVRATADGPTKPLHGVPFTVKENLDCVGSPTTQGVPAHRDAMPFVDAPAVARLKAAGAIPLARTNMPEYGLRIDTANPLRGRTRNPWDRALTPGGSSGGEAAALATGMAPFGLGNDLGGSLRNPAYCCGVAALKPTTGRIARAKSLPPFDQGFASQAMAVDGPMARSVADLRLGLSLLAGRDIRDPRSVDAPLQGPAPAVRRAALVLELPGEELPGATVSAIRRAGQLLAGAGWEVEAAQPPELELVNETWLALFTIDFTDLTRALQPVITGPLFDHLAELCELGRSLGTSPAEAHATRSLLIRLWSEFFARYPVVVGPTWTRLPWPAGADLEPASGVALVRDTTRFVLPGNLLGIPAVALPTGVADGLPTGVQVYADLWREDLCLEAAAVVEAGVAMPTPIDPVL